MLSEFVKYCFFLGKAIKTETVKEKVNIIKTDKTQTQEAQEQNPRVELCGNEIHCFHSS